LANPTETKHSINSPPRIQ